MSKHRKFIISVAGTIARNIINVIFLLVGAIFLCVFLAFMQNRASEYKQKQNSEKILEEVTATLKDNNRTVLSVENEYNKLNQTTIQTLSSYMNYVNMVESFRAAKDLPEEEKQAAVDELCDQIEKMRTDIDSGVIYLVNDEGEVLLCSDKSYVGKSLKSVMTDNELKTLLNYSEDNSGMFVMNGTAYSSKEEGLISELPVEKDGYYTYSTLFTTGEDGRNYFLLMSQSEDVLDAELSGIKQIGSVLKGVTVGKDGFLFAVNSETGKFIYFNNGKTDLSGQNFSDYGMSSAAAQDAFSGYETIDGTSYYCVTKEFSSSIYGKYTIVAAAISEQSMLSRNAAAVYFSCMAFVLVAFIVVGYGMILRNDIANNTIKLQSKFYNQTKDEVVDGRLKYTEEEIQERVKIRITEVMDKRTDPHYDCVLIGNRDRHGSQVLCSTYTLSKMLPLLSVGLAFVFGISFFSQTLLALEDVTAMSRSRLQDVSDTLAANVNTSETVQNYINQQYVAKARLISYIFQEVPEQVLNMNPEDEDVHPLFVRDGDEKIYLTDQYGNIRYSTADSTALQQVCEDNLVTAIYIFDEDGNVIATNTDLWYFTLSEDPESQSNVFYDIIDGKKDVYAQEKCENDVSGELCQYVGSAYYYYTYQAEDGSTIYTTGTNYQAQLDGTWEGAPITKHRGLVQIEISQSEFDNLFKIVSLDYVLSNMHVYGSNSSFVAFDTDEDHTVLYSPVSASIGKTAAEVGVSDSAFLDSGVYNGFQTINGVQYYQSYMLVNDYFLATAIPVDSVYDARNAIASYTLLFSGIFLFISCLLYSMSTDKLDAEQVELIRRGNKAQSNRSSAFILTTMDGRKITTRSAVSRYAKVAWKDRSPEEKLSAIILVYMSIASALIVIALLYALSGNDTDSIFTYIFSGTWERGWNIFAITEALMIMILVITFTKLIQIFVRTFCGTLGAYVETTGNLIVSVVKYGGVIGGLFYSLYLFGFNTTSLITSASILSLVIGLGAQSLISDIIAGIFIVFEGEFHVGDIVTIGDFRGQVLEIGLRTTKLEDTAKKNIKIFNNSSISGVINMTSESSFASIEIGIEYSESLERVEQIFKKGFPKIRKNLPAILDGPFYKGVSSLGESSVNLMINARCEEKNRTQLTRDLQRAVYLLLNDNHVNFPFPQMTISYLQENQGDNKEEAEDKRQKREAEEFVAEQRKKSNE